MADFLTIDAVPYGVLDGGAQESEPETVGESRRAIDGSLRSSEITAKGVYRFSLEPMTEANWQTLRTKIFAGDFLACGGGGIVADDYQVKLDSAGYEIVHESLTFRRGVQVTLRQV